MFDSPNTYLLTLVACVCHLVSKLEIENDSSPSACNLVTGFLIFYGWFFNIFFI